MYARFVRGMRVREAGCSRADAPNRCYFTLLLSPHQRLGSAHVVIAIVNAHDHYMVWRTCAVFCSRRGDSEVVVLRLSVGELTQGLDVSPVTGIDGIFRALDGRKTISGAERNMNLPALVRCRQILDPWRGGVHFKPAAFF